MSRLISLTDLKELCRRAHEDFRPLEILLEFDRLKEVLRQNPIATGIRRERTAEHSWHVAAGVILMHSLAQDPINIERAVTLAVVHDIPEIYVGDTFVYGDGERDRSVREDLAMIEHLAPVDSELDTQLYAMWNEYEKAASPEARFVMAVDMFLPLLLNFSNGSHSSWVRHGVPFSKISRRVERIADLCPRLGAIAREVSADALSRGLIGG